MSLSRQKTAGKPVFACEKPLDEHGRDRQNAVLFLLRWKEASTGWLIVE